MHGFNAPLPMPTALFLEQIRVKQTKPKGKQERGTADSSYYSVQADESILLSLAQYPGEPQELPSNNAAGKGSVLIPGASVFVQGYWPMRAICPGCNGMERCYLLPQ